MNTGEGSSNSTFLPNGVRLRNELLTLEYQPGKPLFKSIRRKTSHLKKMGIHRRDGDFLSIEEALYLTELGAAVVVDQRGNALAIQQLYTLLGQMRVSALRYSAFTQLVRAGYTVRRPDLCRAVREEDEARSSRDYPIKVRAFQFPKHLLDQFPSIQAVNNAGLFGFRLILPPICQPPDISAALLFANDESRPQLDIAFLNGPMAEHVRQLEHIHLADVRRWDRGPWDQCRPRHWPAFHQLRSSENWKVYELRREGLLRNRSRQQAQKRQREPPCEYDYELFADNGAQPIYRVLVVDDRFPPGHPNFAELQKIAIPIEEDSSSMAPLIVATGTPTCVKMSQVRLENEESLSVLNDAEGEDGEDDTEQPKEAL